jgi:hypothetical protein
MFTRLLIPDTVDYMIAGYVVISVMLIGYILSLFLRWRKALREFLILKDDE